MGHADILEYLKRYAGHYDLYRYISFHTLVEKIEPSTDCSTTEHGDSGSLGLQEGAEWTVQSRDLKTKQLTVQSFDSVLVCVG